MTKQYDVAIIGLGTMGSFAAVELARRGLTVAGFDQFAPPHGRGSHSGGTRIYRLAYPEGNGYVPLAQRAGEMWEQAGEELGTQLLHRSGLLYMGLPGEQFLREVQESASSNHLKVETLSAAEVRYRYPSLKSPKNTPGFSMSRQAGSMWMRPSRPVMRMPEAWVPNAFSISGSEVGRQTAAK